MGIGSGTKLSQNDPYQFRKGVSLGKKIYMCFQLTWPKASGDTASDGRLGLLPPPELSLEGRRTLFSTYLANVAYAEQWADGGESAQTRQKCVTPVQ